MDSPETSPVKKSPKRFGAVFILLACGLGLVVSYLYLASLPGAEWKPHQVELPAKTEVVMQPGDVIEATTKSGSIKIVALDAICREYTWEGASRWVEMEPRRARWYGSLGLYFPGPGDHWAEHNGITRGVVDEGQQHFETMAAFEAWFKERSSYGMPFVWNDDGLVVGWDKYLPRSQLNVEVWQVYIAGQKPRGLPGSNNSAIKFTKAKR
jgi:hypothetical protein